MGRKDGKAWQYVARLGMFDSIIRRLHEIQDELCYKVYRLSDSYIVAPGLYWSRPSMFVWVILSNVLGIFSIQ